MQDRDETGEKGEERVKSAKGKVAESFEDLHVYQRARDLANDVYAATRSGQFSRDPGLVDQVRRAAVSILSNIAEGFERGSSIEFVQFLFIAKGSCGELRAQTAVAFDQGYVDRPTWGRLTDQARRTSGMLANLIAHVQGSDYRGAKYRGPARRATAEQSRYFEQLRAAQLANMRSEQVDPAPPSSSDLA